MFSFLPHFIYLPLPLVIDYSSIQAILILCRCSKQAITTTFIRPALAAPSVVSPSATVRRCSSRERPSGTRAADPRLKMTQEETVNHCPTMSMVELPLSFRPMPLQESRNTQTWTDSPQLRKCRRLRMVSVCQLFIFFLHRSPQALFFG